MLRQRAVPAVSGTAAESVNDAPSLVEAISSGLLMVVALGTVRPGQHDLVGGIRPAGARLAMSTLGAHAESLRAPAMPSIPGPDDDRVDDAGSTAAVVTRKSGNACRTRAAVVRGYLVS